MFLSPFHSVQNCQAEGIPLEQLIALLGEQGKYYEKWLCENIQSGKYQETSAPLELWAGGIHSIVQGVAEVILNVSAFTLDVEHFLGLFPHPAHLVTSAAGRSSHQVRIYSCCRFEVSRYERPSGHTSHAASAGALGVWLDVQVRGLCQSEALDEVQFQEQWLRLMEAFHSAAPVLPH
jgi:hypothetical protein